MPDDFLEPPDRLTAETRYNHVWDCYRHMIDWRYRLLTRVLATLAAVAVLCGWLWANNLSRWVFAPWLLGMLASSVAWAMERRTVAIIRDCEQEGATIERASGVAGLFCRFLENEGKPIPYDVLVPSLYLGVVSLCVATSAVLFVATR